MALTSGTIAASATSAADLYTQISSVLTAAGWTNLTDISAATGGTTDVNKVWVSPATPAPVSNVYTGCILFIEVDNTNLRLRIRVAEKYDSSVAGSPALRVKWAAPGVSAATTPTANFALDDTFVALFQAAAASQKVGWVEIKTNASGFAYWVGANSDRLLVMTNSGNANYVCVAGFVGNDYLGGSVQPAGLAAVMLLANHTTTSAGNGSWTPSTAQFGVARVSREPGQAGALTTAFGFALSGPNPASGSNDYGGTITAHHNWFTSMVTWPAYLHGYGSSAYDSKRACFAPLPEFVVSFVNFTNTLLRTDFPNLGDELVINGVTYTSMGPIQADAGSTTRATPITGMYVDGSQF